MLVLVFKTWFEVDRQHAGHHQRSWVSVRDSLALNLVRKLGILGPFVWFTSPPAALKSVLWQMHEVSDGWGMSVPREKELRTVCFCSYVEFQFQRSLPETSLSRLTDGCQQIWTWNKSVESKQIFACLVQTCRPHTNQIWAVMHSVANVSVLPVQGLQNLQKPNIAWLVDVT